jgi:hypothetical protein
MASENQTYPKIPSNLWWSLRKKFHGSVPKEVSTDYLSINFNVNEASAKTYQGVLRRIGLIGEDNKPTDRAIKWRGDQDSYQEACEGIIKDVYPDSLNDLVTDINLDKDKAIKWFMQNLKIGQGAASYMASTYLLIRDADLTKESDSSSQKPKATLKPKGSVSTTQPKNSTAVKVNSEKNTENSHGDSDFQPKVHIDVQIHISPDSSAEQIEQIFSSMAKHLYNRHP